MIEGLVRRLGSHEAALAAVLEKAAELADGDVVSHSDVARSLGVAKVTVFVAELRRQGRWPYRSVAPLERAMRSGHQRRFTPRQRDPRPRCSSLEDWRRQCGHLLAGPRENSRPG